MNTNTACFFMESILYWEKVYFQNPDNKGMFQIQEKTMSNSKNVQIHALPDQSAEELFELKQKIRIHRIKILILILAGIGVVIGLLCAAYLYYDNKTYTSFELVEQIKRTDTEAAEYEEFRGNVLKYTKDGAAYSTLSGSIIWNQTYEMESPRITMCEDYLAIYDQGGSHIFIMNVSGLQGKISTTVPVQRVSIANEGTVAVLMEDSGASYIHIYDKDGKQLAAGGLHIENSGYPLDIALSGDAQKLAVSMLDISEGNVKSTVVFYNYGTVGQNEIDNIVGSYSYSDMVIPSIRFIASNRLLAFGDTEVIIYEGTQKPAVSQEIKFKDNIRSVYLNNEYFGLVFDNPSSAEGYRTTIYNMRGKLVSEQNFELDYTDIGFLQNNLLCVRNATKCMMFTMRGNKRFEYTFDRNIHDVMSGNGQRDYLFILNGETDRIKLKDK